MSKDMTPADWDGLLDKFLRDNELPVLHSPGKVSHLQAQEWAAGQYDAFAERRRLKEEELADARYLEDLRSAAGLMTAGKKTSMRPVVRIKCEGQNA